jgi:hypothetical protein
MKSRNKKKRRDENKGHFINRAETKNYGKIQEFKKRRIINIKTTEEYLIKFKEKNA